MENMTLKDIYEDEEAMRAVKLLVDKGYSSAQVTEAYKNGLVVSQVLTKEV